MGNRISPHRIGYAVGEFFEIRQFQFVQRGVAEYILKVNAVASQQLTQNLSAELLKILGEHANLEIEYVEEIPVLGSGKRKYIVNETQSL